MDLFVAQDDARQRAGGIFTLALCLLAGVVAAVHFVVVFCVGGTLSDGEVHQRVIIWTLPATLAVLLVGIIARVYALRLGGSGIAEELGGRRLDPNTHSPSEKRLLSLVEELSLSSGIPVPEVWLLEGEHSINAFAAGNDPSSAVVGVTLGALERLSLEELRAMLLHEMSHILSGDMRLKFQMLVWVQGILFLTLAGRLMIASDGPAAKGFWNRTGPVPAQLPPAEGTDSIGRKQLRDSTDDSQSRSVVGVLLMFAGSIFSVFGRFLQGTISRDREFAADEAAASAMSSVIPVSGALRKIGGLPGRSWLQNPTAPESSHLFFGSSSAGLGSLFFPTHPTLEDRIRRLNPEWNGDFLPSVARKVSPEEPADAAGAQVDPSQLSPAARAAAAIGARKREKQLAKEKAMGSGPQSYPSSNLDFLGQCLVPNQTVLIGPIKRALRPDWLELTKSLQGAKTLVLEIMKPPVQAKLGLGGATTTQQLLLIDLAMPSLRRIAVGDYFKLLKECRREVVRPDSIDTVRYLLMHVLRRRLGIALGVREVAPVLFEDLPSIWRESQILLSSMVAMGAPTESGRKAAHQAAWSSLGYENPSAPLDESSVVEMVDALEVCERTAPLLKKQLLVASGLAASYQGQVAEREMAVLRMCADAMGSPVPHLATGKMG